MSVVPKTVPEVPEPSYHVKVVIEVPEGTKRQASLVTVQSVSNPFLPGAV